MFGRALSAQDKYATAASKIEIPDGAEQAKESALHATIVKTFSDRAKWAAAFKAVDEKLGLFREDAAFTIAWVDLPEVRHPARLTTDGGATTMEVNFAVLVPYQKTIEQAAEEARKAKAEGKIVKSVLPPVTIEATMAHELTHLFQQTGKLADAPDWFTEGMAAYVEPNDAHIRYFVYDKKPVGRLDAAPDAGEAYGRGWLFFAWADERLGREKFKDFLKRAVVDGEPLEKALEAAMGREWAKLLDMEKSWSDAKVKSIRKAMAP